MTDPRHRRASVAPTASTQILILARETVALILIVWPLLGCFYPLESYLSLGEGDGLNGFASLPIPVTPLTLVFSSLAAIGYLYAVVAKRRFHHQPLMYAFLALASASILWSADPQFSFQRVLRLLPVIALGLALPQFYSQAQMRRLLVIGFLICALASIAVSVLDPALGLARLGNGYEASWRGAFVHKNLTGAIFAAGLIITGIAWRSRAIGVGLASATAATCLLMLVKAHSGTAMGAFAVAMLVTAMLMMVQAMPSRARLLAALFVGLIAVLGAVFVVLVLPQLVGAAGRDMTLTGRTIIWAVVWDRIKLQPWIGYGYAFWATGNALIPAMWRQIGDMVPHSHDSWLELWIQMGVLAPALIALIALTIMHRGMRLVVLSNDRSAALIVGLMVFFLIRSATETEFSDPFITAIFFLVWMTEDLHRTLERLRAAARARSGQPVDRPLADRPAARPPLRPALGRRGLSS